MDSLTLVCTRWAMSGASRLACGISEAATLQEVACVCQSSAASAHSLPDHGPKCENINLAAGEVNDMRTAQDFHTEIPAVSSYLRFAKSSGA